MKVINYTVNYTNVSANGKFSEVFDTILHTLSNKFLFSMN